MLPEVALGALAMDPPVVLVVGGGGWSDDMKGSFVSSDEVNESFTTSPRPWGCPGPAGFGE